MWEADRPTASICTCRGTGSGIGDMGDPGTWEGLRGIRNHRATESATVPRWYSPSLRPMDCDLLTRLGGMPPEWR